MKREIAERLAATIEDDLTVDRVRAVLAEYLRQLAVCPVCNDAGEITLLRDLPVTVREGNSLRRIEDARIEPNGATVCPHCGGPADDRSPRGDPDNLVWHCVLGDSDRDCTFARASDKRETKEVHAECAYRITLPLPVPESE